MSNKPKPPQYDPHIVPAEVGSREQREGKQFGHPVHESAQADPESIHTTDGFTVSASQIYSKCKCSEMSIREKR